MRLPCRCLLLSIERGISETPLPIYRRVYQAPNAINVGCSPDAYPTQQWLACNRDKFIVRKQDKGRISGKCASGGSRTLPGSVALLLSAVLLMFTLL